MEEVEERVMLEEIITRALMISLCYFIIMGFVRLFKYLRSKSIPMQDPVFASSSAQEDPATQQAIKNVRKAFNEQQINIDAMSMKAHAIDCSIMNCFKDICFVREPDNIVSTEIVKIKTKKERIKESKKGKIT